MMKSESHKVLDSELQQFEHEKSGATIVLVKNKDQARSFMVGFRTPPYDDSGLFHIFEHSVLAGSRKYPSKSNFFHLANSSVASFINAMTSSVSTLYPFVSKSPKDFKNLMSIYLDAVFFPNVVDDPRIVKREGWRYEVDKDTQKIKINGIVLSEMKGAFAAPYRSLWYQLSKALLPETPYGHSSGGLPSKIAGLSFQQIQEAHKKYYHPQNSVIYLYGDLDFEEALETLDKDFLSHFSKTKDYVRPSIPLQKNFSYPTPMVSASYPGQPGPNKDFLAKGYVLGAQMTPVEESVTAILAQAFAEHPAAPLKLRMTKEKLAQSTFFMSVGQDNGTAFVFEGSDLAKKDQIDKIISEEIQKVVENGLNGELLTSIINKYEFSQKEKNSNGSHRGMQLGSIVLDNWIYKKESLSQAFDFVTHFNDVRKRLADPNYVKSFFKKNFQDNTRVRWVGLAPDKEFSKKFNSGLEKQVEEALKKSGKEALVQEDKTYQAWVKEKESPEILATVPTLELSDIRGDEPAIPFSTSKIGETEVQEFPQATSGISYVTLLFDLKGVQEKNLKNLALLTSLLKKTNAGGKTFQDLSQEIGTYLGGFSIYDVSFQSSKKRDQYRPSMKVSLKFLNENQDKALQLVQTVLAQSEFLPENHVDNLIRELKTGMANSIANRAPSLSRQAMLRKFYPGKGAYLSEVEGGGFESYIHKGDISAQALIPELKILLENIFSQNRMYFAAASTDPGHMKTLVAGIKNLKSGLPQGAKAAQAWTFSGQPGYDGFAIPGEVQYVTEVASYEKAGLKYSGAMKVFARYLNNNYMIPKLREQAGAYGGSALFSRTGEFYMTTYRDPNLKGTYDIFAKAVDFMKNQKFSSETLKPAILGSLKPYYSDVSKYGKMDTMVGLHLQDQSWEEYMKTKREILGTTAEDLKTIALGLEKALQDSQKSVAGNSGKIKAEGSFLKNVLNLQ